MSNYKSLFFMPETINRKTLSNIVMVCNLIIMVLFMYNNHYLRGRIRKERHEISNSTVIMSDFAVRIGHLPQPSSLNLSTEQLKVDLTIHI